MMKYIVGGILLNSVVACVPLDTEPYDRETDLNPLAELSQCILDSSNGSIINVI